LLDDGGSIEARVLAEARADQLHGERQPVGAAGGTAAAGSPSAFTTTTNRNAAATSPT